MNNDNIELIKFVELNHYDVNYTRTVAHVDPTTSEILIELYLNRRITKCLYCGSTSTVIKETIKKKINHCVKPKQKITINFHQKKFKCKDCMHTFMENNPIGNNISIYGAIQMITSLKSPRKTFKDVANECYTTITNVINYFDSMVQIQRHNLTLVICIDEIYAKRLTSTKYSLIIYDPMSNRILDILDARRKNVLEEYFTHIPLKERLNVRYVNIDMWQTYVDISERYLPNATICVDSFHVIKHLNSAMDKIRLKIQRKYVNTKESDKKSFYWLLKNFHYYFTQNFDSIKYKCNPRSHFSYLPDKYAVLEHLLSIDSDLKEAYLLKEEYREFNLTEDYNAEFSLNKLIDFIYKFKKSKFEEFIEFGRLLNHWKYYIVNSFIRINGKRMSNGPMESTNGRIGRIIEDGYGYTNFNRFRNRCMFSLNNEESINIKKLKQK